VVILSCIPRNLNMAEIPTRVLFALLCLAQAPSGGWGQDAAWQASCLGELIFVIVRSVIFLITVLIFFTIVTVHS